MRRTSDACRDFTRGAAPPRPGARPAQKVVETVLLIATPKPPHGLADVQAESLASPADTLFLELASGPMDVAARERLARRFGANPEQLERFVDGFVADGVVLRGS